MTTLNPHVELTDEQERQADVDHARERVKQLEEQLQDARDELQYYLDELHHGIHDPTQEKQYE